jgi:hypothetical protein
MAGDSATPLWRAVGRSRRGAAHGRTGLPNQDALWLPEATLEWPLILAVADGHGSSKSFRSDRGAQLAVTTAQTVCRHVPGNPPELTNLSAVKRWAEDHLPQEIVRCWREAVDEDIAAHPLAADEGDLPGIAAEHENLRPYLAYGATLLVVVVTAAFILYWQLGDGDILTVADNGEVSKPLPGDERLFANETTSLCAEQAWRDVRTAFQVLVGAPPALILVASDGYANSYCDEAGFLQVGRDLLAIIRTEGLEYVDANLETWLDEVSRQGSGDDVTLGILYRRDAV